MSYVWQASGGRQIPIKQLTDEHLVNILNWLEKHSREPYGRSMLSDFKALAWEARSRDLDWNYWRTSPPLYDGDILAYRQARAREEDPVFGSRIVTLKDLKPGEKFHVVRVPPWVDYGLDVFIKSLPVGDIDRCIQQHHSRRGEGRDGGYAISIPHSDVVRYAVVNLRTGRLYWMPSFQRVTKVEIELGIDHALNS